MLKDNLDLLKTCSNLMNYDNNFIFSIKNNVIFLKKWLVKKNKNNLAKSKICNNCCQSTVPKKLNLCNFCWKSNCLSCSIKNKKWIICIDCKVLKLKLSKDIEFLKNRQLNEEIYDNLENSLYKNQKELNKKSQKVLNNVNYLKNSLDNLTKKSKLLIEEVNRTFSYNYKISDLIKNINEKINFLNSISMNKSYLELEKIKKISALKNIESDMKSSTIDSKEIIKQIRYIIKKIKKSKNFNKINNKKIRFGYLCC